MSVLFGGKKVKLCMNRTCCKRNDQESILALANLLNAG